MLFVFFTRQIKLLTSATNNIHLYS